MADSALTDLLHRIDAALQHQVAALAELQAIRAELAGVGVDGDRGKDVSHTLGDDLADGNLIEISTAVAIFNRPPDSLRWLCRKQGCGRKIGGRWMVSPVRVRRWLNGD